jgi:hypothetical protein
MIPKFYEDYRFFMEEGKNFLHHPSFIKYPYHTSKRNTFGTVKVVVFKLCAAAPSGAERNPKGAAIFFSSIQNIPVYLSKFG